MYVRVFLFPVPSCFVIPEGLRAIALVFHRLSPSIMSLRTYAAVLNVPPPRTHSCMLFLSQHIVYRMFNESMPELKSCIFVPPKIALFVGGCPLGSHKNVQIKGDGARGLKSGENNPA